MLIYNFAKLPHVLMTGKVREKAGWSHSGRRMVVNLLVVFQGGSCVFAIEGKEYTFRKGDVALIPQGTLYKPHTDDFCEYTFFHFDGDLLPCDKKPEEIPPFESNTQINPSYGRITQQEEADLYFDYKIPLGGQLQNVELMVRKCVNTRLNYANKMQLLLSFQFSEIMFHISQSYCEQFRTASALPAQVSKILTYIEQNYTHGVTLDDICKNMNVSKQYCMRVFKKYMNTTINDYILGLRMRHAAYLLGSTYMNVSQTADYLGFSSTSYFSRVFKSYYGISPSDYSE
ncbi:MAG: helix-turn-helix transcriptional regulator [Clostridia bacterium]|nr:helix-turn-helix transcriptional regulator [Clostridia bacterium]